MIAQIILDNTKLTPGHVTSMFVVFGDVYKRQLLLFSNNKVGGETIKKFYTCRYDRAFKEVFMNESNKMCIRDRHRNEISRNTKTRNWLGGTMGTRINL